MGKHPIIMEISLDQFIQRFKHLDRIAGFLNASEPPLPRLADPYYESWERAMDLLPSLLLTGTVRNHIDHKVQTEPLVLFAFGLFK